MGKSKAGVFGDRNHSPRVSMTLGSGDKMGDFGMGDFGLAKTIAIQLPEHLVRKWGFDPGVRHLARRVGSAMVKVEGRCNGRSESHEVGVSQLGLTEDQLKNMGF